ncbi:peptide/nickel transport system permease protein/oligopeptide transport system permease protein [Devosia lucknowensis]|uniref:Peptide/nickel transport system permease protein/oligopeptide transport system permease protein n=1 Tax=Devosia lucknowensis TaxID=1096929 RepID=A0A1Y6G9Q0_9HYPH|nr:ABC transporter permease [Devosia lucknowensis]SMQ86103.1 peptide/nickel transport system permease protein/oligopeptide transport system permease protein [Devosia lucknowensis]
MSAEIKQRGSLELTLRRLLADRAGLLAMLFIIALVAAAIGADGIAALTGHGPTAQFLDIGLTPTGLPVPPGGEFLFGTDQLGRDVLVRLAHGARISLAIGLVASLLAAMIGVTVGLVAGYFGGWIDVVLGRLMDLVMSIPVLLCMLSLVAVFGPSLPLSLTVIVFFSWTTMGRVIRGQVLSLREREFVTASRSMGAGHLSIMVTDILPNLGAPIIIYTTMMVPTSIIFEATLSFLGLGIVPPAPSWGGMLAEAANNSIYMFAWWLVLFPGLALLFTTLSFNILGDALRDALDPASMRHKALKKKKTSVRSAP